jgi:hypothetical protein
MALWRDHLFAWMTRNATRATDFFNIPPNRVVELGTPRRDLGRADAARGPSTRSSSRSSRSHRGAGGIAAIEGW